MAVFYLGSLEIYLESSRNSLFTYLYVSKSTLSLSISSIIFKTVELCPQFLKVSFYSNKDLMANSLTYRYLACTILYKFSYLFLYVDYFLCTARKESLLINTFSNI